MNKQYTLATLLLLSFSFGLFACEKGRVKTLTQKKNSKTPGSPAAGRRVHKQHHYGSSENNNYPSGTPSRRGPVIKYKISNQQPNHTTPTQEYLAQKQMLMMEPFHTTLWSS